MKKHNFPIANWLAHAQKLAIALEKHSTATNKDNTHLSACLAQLKDFLQNPETFVEEQAKLDQIFSEAAEILQNQIQNLLKSQD